VSKKISIRAKYEIGCYGCQNFQNFTLISDLKENARKVFRKKDNPEILFSQKSHATKTQFSGLTFFGILLRKYFFRSEINISIPM
jgi:hypothetical protein